MMQIESTSDSSRFLGRDAFEQKKDPLDRTFQSISVSLRQILLLLRYVYINLKRIEREQSQWVTFCIL